MCAHASNQGGWGGFFTSLLSGCEFLAWGVGSWPWKPRQRISERAWQSLDRSLENCRHLDQAIWKTGFLELQNNSADVDTGEILEPQTVLDSTDLFGLPDDDAGYSPSVCTDFSGFLPRVSLDKSLDVSSNYDPEAVVRLPAETFKLPWERCFWNRFLDPNSSAMDMLGKGFKRPLPAPVVQEPGSASSVEVERRVFPKPFQEVRGFLQHVRDIPERSWQGEREAMWETSVRRWVALTDTWLRESSTLIAAMFIWGHRSQGLQFLRKNTCYKFVIWKNFFKIRKTDLQCFDNVTWFTVPTDSSRRFWSCIWAALQ